MDDDIEKNILIWELRISPRPATIQGVLAVVLVLLRYTHGIEITSGCEDETVNLYTSQ